MILHLWELALVLLLYCLQGVSSINCYICSSLNGSNPNCQDPFNPAMSTYKEKCMVPKQGHVGMFPANFCIKIDGKNVDTKEIMVIRACVIKTMDSQCGEFRYQDTMMTGCIQSCDYDGCNRAFTITSPSILTIFGLGSLWLHIT
ncbi:uncharacterized protein LOC128998639 [Macrosteles quadrilineatus]|uniref:uncharacterized protein LOC128982834 n=1 Tax=Macrosteles quadrilineatus TaxID=74068 RepID=UPI0023E0BD9D|nr:uncharacterized protein LOC128982834 [Macrosteles quadrilineatus]XP_054257837.1 uncharacterized protein LOC128982834 [Macrosteles quadrilineatus]XP_054280837.1 uncharacterized protein LOC128998639 [Macrosteles quadrilineatus]XP_054280838.1 uncharacterized protein LOC128998639 [Macrosteles quadrilineatus]